MITSETIKQEAYHVGFHFCGISKAEKVNEKMSARYMQKISSGHLGNMDYLARNVEKRLNPDLLVPGVKSIISVALNYAPAENFPEGEIKISAYALGKDYHEVVKGKLKQLAEKLSITDYRAFCDTAPVLERYWAEQGGIGWIGRNDQLIIPGAGCMFFLGELFILEEVDNYDSPALNRCGSCTKCVDACPMGCLGNEVFPADRCLSYQTIENRGDISQEAQKMMGDTFYGCDRCIKACPWTRFSTPTDVAEFAPNPALMAMTRHDWQNLTIEQYQALFKGSAVKRAKYEGIIRNIKAVLD